MKTNSFKEFLTAVGVSKVSNSVSQNQLETAQQFYDFIVKSQVFEPSWMLSSQGVLGFYWKDCQDNRQLYLSVDIDETGLGIFAFVERINDKITMSSSGRVRPNGIAKIYNAFMLED